MPQITDIEEVWLNEGIQTGIQTGIQKGRQGAVIRLLQLRFGQLPQGLVDAIANVTSDTHLDQLLEAAALAVDIETFSRRL